MNSEQVKELLDKAKQTLRDAEIDPESPLGVAAFPGVWAALGATPLEAAESAGPETGKSRSEADTPFAKLGTWSGLNSNLLEDAIEVQGDYVLLHIPTARLPRSKAGRQRVIAYALLATMRQGFDLHDVPVDSLNELLKHYDAFDQNIWGNLQAEGGSFNRRGNRGSRTYRLTIPGLERARDVFLELFRAD